MLKTIPAISKSKYLAGLQCPKLLWTHYNAKDLIPAVDAGTQARFDEGHKVGELAKQLYPDGVEVPWQNSIAAAISQSQALLGQGDPFTTMLTELRRCVGERGSVVVYNASFETGCLREAAKVYPANRAWVDSVLARIEDSWCHFGRFTSTTGPSMAAPQSSPFCRHTHYSSEAGRTLLGKCH